MVIDHIPKSFLVPRVLTSLLGNPEAQIIRALMIMIGRISFPIFVWFAAEACHKTSNRGKHMLRLINFTFISEIPFQLAFYHKFEYSVGFHSVIATIAIATLVIYTADYAADLFENKHTVIIISLLSGMLLAHKLGTDYGYMGVAAIVLVYYAETHKSKLVTLAIWITLYYLVYDPFIEGVKLIGNHGYEGAALYWAGAILSIPMLAKYNGERGHNVKWSFYIFYPAHLLILYGLYVNVAKGLISA